MIIGTTHLRTNPFNFTCAVVDAPNTERNTNHSQTQNHRTLREALFLGGGLNYLAPLLATLWMDKILHHLRIPAIMTPLQTRTSHGFPQFQGGANGFVHPHADAPICAGLSARPANTQCHIFSQEVLPTWLAHPGGGRQLLFFFFFFSSCFWCCLVLVVLLFIVVVCLFVFVGPSVCPSLHVC